MSNSAPAESFAFAGLQCFNIILAAAVISLFDLVTGATEHTSDHTQPHPSEVLTMVRGATDFHRESAVRHCFSGINLFLIISDTEH